VKPQEGEDKTKQKKKDCIRALGEAKDKGRKKKDTKIYVQARRRENKILSMRVATGPRLAEGEGIT